MIRMVARPRGPLAVDLEDECEIVAPDGTVIEKPPGKRILICRCGHSARPPLCDGAHYRTDFEKPPATEADEEFSE